LSYLISEVQVRCGEEIKGVWVLDPTHADPRELAEQQFGAERIVSVRVHVSANNDKLQASENKEEQP
jgi:hypothetical protein